TPKPTPAPLREAPAPSPVTVAPPEPAAPAAPAAPPTPAAPAAPAIGRQTMEISAPKNVSHLDCNIAKPDYPALSRRRGETGTAYVKFVVGLTGKLENIELKKSSGFSRLDDAALAAAHASACKPYLEDGQPIRAAYTQPYNFNLED
ncbi:energy transducer TonB, partial [Paraburkholderia graminis]